MGTNNKRLKNRLSDTFELPKEIVLDIPNIKMIGSMEAVVENHKGILEYSQEILRINSASGIIKILGKNLEIKEINQEDILIKGDIDLIEFIK